LKRRGLEGGAVGSGLVHIQSRERMIMTNKKSKLQSTPKKTIVTPPKGSPMEKFHQAMKKIVSVPKKDLKDK